MVAPGAPEIWSETPGNVAFHWQIGDKAATEAAFAKAAHVTKLTFANNRLIPNAMEPRAANALHTATAAAQLAAPHLAR